MPNAELNKVRNDFIIRLLIPTALMAAGLWYLGSLWDARMREQNLILIEPVVILMIPFYLGALFYEYRRYVKEVAAARLAAVASSPETRRNEAGDGEIANATRNQALFLVTAAVSVAGFYILGAIPATILLIVAGLLILGVRKPLPLIVTPLVTTLVLWAVFIEIFGIRMPLFFPGI